MISTQSVAALPAQQRAPDADRSDLVQHGVYRLHGAHRLHRRRRVHAALITLSTITALCLALLPARTATAAPGGGACTPDAAAADTSPRQTLAFRTDGHAVKVQAQDARWSVSFLGAAPWPHVVLRAAEGPWDLRTAGRLALPVQNPGDRPVNVHLRLGDDEAATSPDHALAARFVVPAGSQRTLIVPLCAIDPRQMGMRTGPATKPPADIADALTPTSLDGRLDLGKARSLYLVLDGREGDRTLVIGAPTTGPGADPRRDWRQLIDALGQYNGADWPGKVRDEATWRRSVDEQGQRWQVDAHSDRWGAVVGGDRPAPIFEAKGFFRTARDPRGRWWFVTPEGRGFFSIGVNTVDLHDGATYVEGREWMFKDLPPTSGSPLSGHYGRSDLRRDMGAQAGRRFDHGRYFNFYTANLQRLDGADWRATWRTRTLARLRAWGFNTLGNWSAAELSERTRKDRLPFTVALSIEGEGFARISDGVDYWGRMPDPFDPRFAAAVDETVRRGTAPHRGDPMLLGYFVDNELAWGDGNSPDPRRRHALVIHALEGPDGPARRALLGLLAGRHASVADWQSAWGAGAVVVPAGATTTGPASWAALSAIRLRLADRFDAAALAELSTLSRALADAYYRTVAQALRRHDPDHLYLGSRFAAQTDEAVGACDQHCDVVSFNIYHQQFADARRARFGELTKPALVGEYNFSSTDRGPFWPGLVDVGSESARGPHYAAYLHAVADDPQFVGAHWFQFLDEPASGRLLDGENAHFGLVAITDLAYTGFVDAVTAANREAPRRRAVAR